MLGQHSNQIWKHQVKKSGAFPTPTIRNQDVLCHELVVYLGWALAVSTGHAQVFYGPANVGPWTLAGEEDNYDTPDFIVGATTTALPGDTIYYYVHWTSGAHSGDTDIQGPFVDGECPFPVLFLDSGFADCVDVIATYDWFDGGNPVIATGAIYELFISTAGAGGPFVAQGAGAYDDSGHIQGYGDGTSLPPNATIWFKLKIVYGTQVIESPVSSILNGPC
jgi:hypothetical protein